MSSRRSRVSAASSSKKASTPIKPPPKPGKFKYDPTRRSPLTTLPYHLLLDIFIYAATDPKTLHSWPTSSVLLNFATLNKAFTEPALTALYSYPPLFPVVRATHFFEAIEAQPDLAGRVRELVFEVEPLLVKRRGGEKFDLLGALEKITRLQHLEFRHSVDMYKMHSKAVNWSVSDVRWKYPNVFSVLDKNGIRLRSWRWEANFLTGVKKGELEEWEKAECLGELRSLTLCGIGRYHTKHPIPMAFASTITSLTLEHCDTEWDLPDTIRSLRVVDNTWLKPSNLPRNLLRLEVTECTNFNGHFLSQIGIHCPNLRSLTLCPAPAKSSFRDDTPDDSFDAPVFPESLHTLRVYNHNMQTEKEGIEFIRSLLPPNLPRLFDVVIDIGISEVGWKERADFRKNWVGKLEGRGVNKLRIALGTRASGPDKFMENDFLEDKDKGRIFTVVRTVKRKKWGKTKAKAKRRRGEDEESEGEQDYVDDDDDE